ncbi:hypothetical protein D9615_009266 [Tricholomella constricta]|uniref:Uncharacterized protein n=1 Tax=Tricholomella constricta TaxID=117010 RepID=A0A8H5LWQ2_9AGAR|nr:hypothetical protein D9615_009266 [Tricholomella constricta]
MADVFLGHRTNDCIYTPFSSPTSSRSSSMSYKLLSQRKCASKRLYSTGEDRKESLKTKRNMPAASPQRVCAWATFEKDDDCIDLRNADNFLDLLDAIRSHLLNSSSSRWVYVNTAQRFYASLRPDLQSVMSRPEDQDFLSHVRSNWPVMRSVKSLSGRVRWGYVAKGPGEPHTINILTDIVEVAELSRNDLTNKKPKLSLPLLNLMLTALMLHELSHSFTKTWFKEIITPLGIGHGRDPWFGESGHWVENIMMGGTLVVEWDQALDFGKMSLIDRVILHTGLISFEVDEVDAAAVLSSLQGQFFALPPATKIALARPTSVRARITMNDDDPNSVFQPLTKVGLGLMFPVEGCGRSLSFIGDDR